MNDDEAGKHRSRARDAFSAQRDELLRRANAHKGLSHRAFKVLAFVSDHASVRQDGYSWFSLANIGLGTGMSVTAARRGLADAERHGFLHIVSGGQKRKPNQYWPILDGKPLAGVLPEKDTALAAELPLVGHDPLAAELPVVRPPRSARTGKFTTVKSDTPLRSESPSDYGQNCRRTFLTDLPNDPSNPNLKQQRSTISAGAALPAAKIGNEEATEKEGLGKATATTAEQAFAPAVDQEFVRQAEKICLVIGVTFRPSATHKGWPAQLAQMRKVDGIDFEIDLLPIVTKKKTDNALPPFTSLFYFRQAAIDAHQARGVTTSAPPAPIGAVEFEPTDANGWDARLHSWLKMGGWLPKYGPRPRSGECKAPAMLLAQAINAWRLQGGHPIERFCLTEDEWVKWDKAIAPRKPGPIIDTGED